MRVAGKIAGVVNGSFRGGFPAFPGNITSAALKANTARPITGVISTSDTQYDVASSTVNKPFIEFEDWEVTEGVASSCDVGEALPRVVFGGAPTLEEARDATFQLRTALDQYVLLYYISLCCVFILFSYYIFVIFCLVLFFACSYF